MSLGLLRKQFSKFSREAKIVENSISLSLKLKFKADESVLGKCQLPGL